MTYSDILTYISSEVLLLAQDSLIPVQLNLEPRDELSHERLVGRLTKVGLEHLFCRNRTNNRVPLRILDTASLLVLGDCAGFGGDQGGARSESGEMTADGARLE